MEKNTVSPATTSVLTSVPFSFRWNRSLMDEISPYLEIMVMGKERGSLPRFDQLIVALWPVTMKVIFSAILQAWSPTLSRNLRTEM